MSRNDLTEAEIQRGEGTMCDRVASKARLRPPPELPPGARCCTCSAVAVRLDADGDPTCGCGPLAMPPHRIRLMRGQVVVREETPPPSATLWTPAPGPRQVKTHRGVVLGLGPPARLTEHPASPEVPHGFQVGDVVQYHFAAAGTQAARTRAWVDGKPATWLVQAEVDAVWEEEPEILGCGCGCAS